MNIHLHKSFYSEDELIEFPVSIYVRCRVLSWHSSWGYCHSSQRRSPPPPSHSARSAPLCSVTQSHAGSPGSAVAMTNVPMVTTQANIMCHRAVQHISSFIVYKDTGRLNVNKRK